MSTAARRPLVVGYGNALSGDPAIGWYVAERVAADRRLTDLDVQSVRRLTTGLAANFAWASRVVLVGAAVDRGLPGSLHIADVVGGVEPAISTDYGDAAMLLTLADEICGVAPPTILVTVAISRNATGPQLTPAVAAAIPRALEAVAYLSLRQRLDRAREPLDVARYIPCRDTSEEKRNTKIESGTDSD